MQWYSQFFHGPWYNNIGWYLVQRDTSVDNLVIKYDHTYSQRWQSTFIMSWGGYFSPNDYVYAYIASLT